LNDNKLAGGEVKNLNKYKGLHVLKLANNLIKTFADLEVLVFLIILTYPEFL
jgi:hypothetical protein